MSIKDVWGIVLLAAIIIGGIYSGVFTATEAAAVGAFAALLIGLSGGRKAIPKIVSALEETARTTSLVFFLIVGSTFFAFFLTMSGVTIWVAETVINLPLPKAGILAMIIFIYLPLGMIMDTMSMMLITLPIVYPIVIQLGYNGVWFGVIITQLCELALITPPVGMNLYVIQGVSPPGVTLEDVLMGSVPIIIMQFVTLSIIVAFPQISLLLPSLMVK